MVHPDHGILFGSRRLVEPRPFHFRSTCLGVVIAGSPLVYPSFCTCCITKEVVAGSGSFTPKKIVVWPQLRPIYTICSLLYLLMMVQCRLYYVVKEISQDENMTADVNKRFFVVG